MADIRINALTSTAATTASDDYLAVDGSANGTRKLSAYSPTFGGNLTVSGTGTTTFNGNTLFNPSTAGNNYTLWKSGSVLVGGIGDGTAFGTTANDFVVHGYTGSTKIYSNSALAATFTSSGNLTVSGTGTSSFAGGLNILSNSSATGAVDIGADARASNLRLSLNAAAGNDREIITYTAGLQRWKIGVTGTAESGSNAGSNWILQAYADNGSTSLGNAISITRSTLATTLAGNLTVSGTGQSSIAGNLKVNNQNSAGDPTALGALQLFATANSATGAGGVEWKADAGGSGYGYRKLTVFDGSSAYDLYTQSRSNSASWTTRLVLKSNGNVLIGGTSDGGQKLQVAGTVAKTAAGPTTIAIASNEAFNLRDEGRLFIVGNASAGSRYLGLEYYDVGNGAYRNVAAVPNGGNFLVGTTVDSSALLQVGTNTTTAAGGMKFGTDTSLFRSAAGALQLETSATAVFEIDGAAGNTRGVVIQAAGTEQAAITVAASGTSLLLSTGSPRTTALTLDSSQNATFAGTGQQSFNGIIQVAKTAAGSNSNLLDLYNKGTTNNTSSGIAFSANNASSAQRTSAEIRGIMTVTTAGSEESELWFSTRGAGVASGTAALKIANTGDATFAGDVTVNGGNVGVGTSALANYGMDVRPTALSGAGQAGLNIVGAYTSSATSFGYGVRIIPGTAASAFTMANGAGVYVDAPSIGASSTVTNQFGINIANQGAAGITNAYGINIAAQSGAATTNIGLRNLGATVLATPAAAVTLSTNSTMTFELTSDTSLKILVRGSDGITRSVALTLA